MRCSAVISQRAESARPAVVVFCALDPGDWAAARELDAGMEEEGIPARIVAVPDAPTVELAHAAAQASNLDVGIGVDREGNISVHHAKLPPETAALNGTGSAARLMGHNAARLVNGTPFKFDLPAADGKDSHCG